MRVLDSALLGLLYGTVETAAQGGNEAAPWLDVAELLSYIETGLVRTVSLFLLINFGNGAGCEA